MNKYKNIVKLSNLFLEAIGEIKGQKIRQIQNSFDDFTKKYSDAVKDSNLLNAAVERRWLNGAETIMSRVNRNLNDLSHHLQNFRSLVNTDEAKLPKLSDIFAELLQVNQEFGEYQFDLKEKTISVVTEPITLGEIPFGPFEIKLFISQIDKLYTGSPYRVIALEPNPAGTDSSVTHPHVSSEILCEGDGHVSIRKSLEQGRLCDFFTMVVNILQNYNPDSPYVSLEDWDGISCYDCGYTIGSDDCYYCEYCNRDYCSQCSSYCRICDMTICLGCAYECPSCNEPVCHNCAAKCKECEETFCKDCLTEEGICQICEENRKENSDEEQEKRETCAEVQPGGMGETVVHA